MRTRRRTELLLVWVCVLVPPSLLQPPLPLSLPVHTSIFPPPWRLLPLSQLDPLPLFSNSSPFSSSQRFFVLPGSSGAPVLRASFGPYSVTQLISEPLLQTSPSVRASLLSEEVERARDEAGEERFQVRVLFHERGDASSLSPTCVTLHAFRETEELRASCIAQPPLWLCLATLALPRDWLKDPDQSQKDPDKRYDGVQRHRWKQTWQRRRRRHGNVDGLRTRPNPGMEAPRVQQDQRRNQIQLYYSSFTSQPDLKAATRGRCAEDGATRSQTELFHIKAITLSEEAGGTARSGAEEDCLDGQREEVLEVDRHVVLRYHRGPVLPGQPIKVSVNLRSNVTADVVAVRMKVKTGLVSTAAQSAPDPEPWAVTVDRSRSLKHEVTSVFCRNRAGDPQNRPPLLQQVACLSINGLRRSFDVAMTVSAHWWVEYSGRGQRRAPGAAAVSAFSFADRHIVGVVPVTESHTIINTAILSNRPVALPVTVLAMSRDGQVSDVTSAVTCRSGNENAIKVSGDCSSVFVDGSESGLGSTCAKVEFLLGMLSGSVCLKVWAPSVPLRVWLGDPVLNAIDGWSVFTEDGCRPVYQRSSVHVLTQFTARDDLRGTVRLLGSSDRFVDVTDLVHLRVEDPQVASLGPQNTLTGLKPGTTSLHVVSEQWDGILGRCDVTVTSDPVIPGDLSVQVVSGLGMSVKTDPAHPAIVTATVTAHNVLSTRRQEASVSVWVQFSDDSASLLSSFADLPHLLRLSSLAETVVMVTAGSGRRVLAQGDGGGPLLQAELLVSGCSGHLTNSVGDPGGGSGTRRLARGSGWVRVNLDPERNRLEEFGFSDTLVDPDPDVYTSNEDDGGNASSGSTGEEKLGARSTGRRWNKLGGGWTTGQNPLERAVLLPSLEENFYPGRGVEAEPGGDGEERSPPEVGVGVVSSLLGLCAVLFLANCLPGALRVGRRTRIGPEREEHREEHREEPAVKEGEERSGGEEVKEEQEEDDGPEGVEIIC